jgi:hypothetical protein
MRTERLSPEQLFLKPRIEDRAIAFGSDDRVARHAPTSLLVIPAERRAVTAKRSAFGGAAPACRLRQTPDASGPPATYCIGLCLVFTPRSVFNSRPVD